ncbi:MAG: hypothetical protein AAFQ80_00530 [Cyanobacteria bacterium J06621_8]
MTLYLSGVAAYSLFLLCCMFRDQECSKTDSTSWLVVFLASALWMIVIPLSILELSLKAKAKAQKKIVHESNNPDATLEITAHEIGELNPSNS